MATHPSRIEPNASLEALRHTPHICFAEALRSANRTIARIYARHLDGLGVNVSQASLLMRLYYLGEPTMALLAEQMETDRTTMVRNVGALERSGHVESIIVGRDRAHRYRLTSKGRSDLDAALPHWEDAQRELRSALGDEMWETMMGGMRTLVRLDGLDCPRDGKPPATD